MEDVAFSVVLLTVHQRSAYFVSRRLSAIGQANVLVSVFHLSAYRRDVNDFANDRVRALRLRGVVLMRCDAYGRSGFAADQLLDAIQHEAAYRYSVDRIHDFARLHARTCGRQLFDRLHEHSPVFQLIDVDADPAEVSAVERFVKALYLAWREVHGVRII